MKSLDADRDRAIGSLVGLAVGDALGTTVEFAARGTFAPITEFRGGGPFHLKPGEWTDDTSMALCLADSLNASTELDLRDLADRFVRWWQQGENSVTGRCFDIGIATREALARYQRTGDPRAGSTDLSVGGNGSLMRLAPVAVRFRDVEAAILAARSQSLVTHASPECLDACGFFAELLVEAIAGSDKASVLAPRKRALSAKVAAIAGGAWREKTENQISSSGYVVNTLEAAMWCVDRSDDFRSAVLRAANLGHDADTVAAVTGQLAGAVWGLSGIPTQWLAQLAWRDEIVARSTRLWDAGVAQSNDNSCGHL
jgi:ADP-ribosyl-[dinitrogen reductase] hydrolase